MTERGVETSSPAWSPFEMLLLKECALRLATADDLEISSLERKYNDAARLSQDLPDVHENKSTLLQTTAEKKKPSEIENMLKSVLKEDEVFKIMYKNQISLNFKH